MAPQKVHVQLQRRREGAQGTKNSFGGICDQAQFTPLGLWTIKVSEEGRKRTRGTLGTGVMGRYSR